MSNSGAQSPNEIRAEIAARQNRLAHTVDELTTRANPKNLMAQGKEDAVAIVRDAVLDERGGPRVERLAAAGAVVVAMVVVVVLLRRHNSA